MKIIYKQNQYYILQHIYYTLQYIWQHFLFPNFQFDFAQVGGNAIKAKPNNFLKTNTSNTLCFESRFESGNLLKAVKV